MQKDLNSTENIVISGNNIKRKEITCWYCKIHGKNILDKHGCCKRCGTNLKKYPTRECHPYPKLDRIEREVLGDVVPINATDVANDQEEW